MIAQTRFRAFAALLLPEKRHLGVLFREMSVEPGEGDRIKLVSVSVKLQLPYIGGVEGTWKAGRTLRPCRAKPKGEGDLSFGSLSVAILNGALRPMLAKWHPLLLDYEPRRPEGKSSLEHERVTGGTQGKCGTSSTVWARRSESTQRSSPRWLACRR